MSKRKTGWFNGAIEIPFHIGEYEFLGSEFRWFWDGKNWGFIAGGKKFFCNNQSPIWRGLAEKPE